ncbi:MAG: CPBP family intramembrane metalloprotease [Saprospiraceae bacterium]|jgi:membrane protease YdiL (CAAX protease family)|nr:CPBP family intramembrane metalloprotease [Saprospiraceae bacterium]
MKELKDNIKILTIMTGINLLVLWNFISSGKTKHGIGYFVFFYIAIFIIHYFTKKLAPKIEIEVKEPKKELSIATLFSILGLVFLALNFLQKSDIIQNIAVLKIPILLGMFLFSFPLGVFIYLLFRKYKILQLGLKLKPVTYLFLGVIIWGLTGIFAYLFNKSGIIWKEGLEELGGISGIIIKGIIGAALVEEFSRFVIQSRFEKLFKTSGINILFATTIWAFMHFPVTYFKGVDSLNTTIYCIQIIPIGFIWGYLTHRTKSILPATLVHGLNLWGFQNG